MAEGISIGTFQGELVVEFVSSEPGPRRIFDAEHWPRNVARFVLVNSETGIQRSSHELAPGETLAIALATETEVVRLEMIQGTVRIFTASREDGGPAPALLLRRLETLAFSRQHLAAPTVAPREEPAPAAPTEADALDAFARTVRRLAERVDQAEQTRDAAQAAATASLEQVRALEAEAARDSHALRSLAAGLDASQAEVERLRNLCDERFDAQVAERQQSAARLAELAVALDEAKRALAAAENDDAWRGWKDRADAMEDRAAALAGDRDAWKKKADGLASALVLAEQDRDYWKGTAFLHQDEAGKAGRLAAALEDAKRALATDSDRLRDANRRIAALVEDVQLARAEQNGAENERDGWKSKAEGLESERETWKADAGLWKAEVDRLKEDRRFWHARAEVLIADVSALETDRDGWKAKAGTLEADRDTWRLQATTGLAQRVETLKAEWAAERDALQGHIRDVEANLAGWKSRANQAELDALTLRNSRDNLSQRVDALEATVDNLQGQVRRERT